MKLNITDAEYKKTANKIRRHKFWIEHSVPIHSELFQLVVSDYLDRKNNSNVNTALGFDMSDTFEWDDKNNMFIHSWYSACDTDYNESGYAHLSNNYDINGNPIEINHEI